LINLRDFQNGNCPEWHNKAESNASTLPHKSS
jgi:hypothetical protein